MQRLLVHSLAPNMRDVDIIYLFPPGCPPIVEIARESPTARKATVSFATEARSVPISNCRLVSHWTESRRSQRSVFPQAEAVRAFNMLPGQDDTDSMGRMQKVRERMSMLASIDRVSRN